MKNIIRKYTDKKNYDLSCSEAIIYAANEKYNLGLSEREFNMLAPFSGGMMEQETCGIVTASISVLGIMFTKGVSHNSPLMTEAVIDLKQRFRAKYGSTICSSLIKNHRDDIVGCENLINEASEILDEVIKIYKRKI